MDIYHVAMKDQNLLLIKVLEALSWKTSWLEIKTQRT